MSNMQMNAMESTLAKWQPYAQLRPDVYDNVDFDTSFRLSWHASGAPAEGLVDADEMEVEREESKQLQKAQIEAQTAEAGSKALKNVADAEVL
jgi:hypothetical protein